MRPLHLCPVGTCALWVLVPCGCLCPVGAIQKMIGSGALPIFCSSTIAPDIVLISYTHVAMQNRHTTAVEGGSADYAEAVIWPVHPVHNRFLLHAKSAYRTSCT